MDELLDLFDVLADVADLGDMADAGIDLGEIVADLDIADLESEYLEGLTELNDAWLPADGSDLTLDADDLGLESDLELSDAGFEELGANLEAASTSIDDVLASYPEHVQKLLPNPIYSPDFHPSDGPSTFGTYQPETGELRLYDHVRHVEETLHHEIGHALTESQPELKTELVNALHSTGYADSKVEHLSSYPREQHPGELCAEAFREYMANPTAFGAAHASAAAVIERAIS